MPNNPPVITNKAPKGGSISGVLETYRFSLRDPDTPVDPTKLQVLLGSGQVFYKGDELPNLTDVPAMSFEAASGSPTLEANVELDGDYLKIHKNQAFNQKAVFRMGGLEAPSAPDDPIMVEFTLLASLTDMALDSGSTGVYVSLMVGDTGFSLELANNGSNELELYDADLPPHPILHATISYDWDSGVGLNPDGSNTFKVLWDPRRDIMSLFVKDPASDVDVKLYSGSVAQFGLVPEQERKATPPWLIFGHGAYPVATSISRWKEVGLQNVVTQPVEDGIFRGDHVTVLRSDNQVDYDGESLPTDAESAWLDFPESFGNLGGSSYLTPEGVVLQRNDFTKGVGFYRSEPRCASELTVVDFSLKAQTDVSDVLTLTLGCGIYISDGVKMGHLALYQDGSGTQSVDVLSGSSTPVIQSFSVMRDYRLVLEPGVGCWLYNKTAKDGVGVVELVLFVPYSDLADDDRPGPGVGFVNNGGDGPSASRMTVGSIRYYVGATYTLWDDFLSPTPTWTWEGTPGSLTRPGTQDSSPALSGAEASIEEAAGVVTVRGLSGVFVGGSADWLYVLNGDNPGYYKVLEVLSDTEVVIDNPSAVGADSENPSIGWEVVSSPSFMVLEDWSGNAQFSYSLVGELQPDDGWSAEFKCRVASYELPEGTDYEVSGENPVRADTGVGFRVKNGSGGFWLGFAEAGPPLGKILYIFPSSLGNAEDSKLPELLRRIRSGDPSVEGYYAIVDWSEFKTYRLESTVGGKVLVEVDGAVLLEFSRLGFDLPVDTDAQQIIFGHFDGSIESISDWEYVLFSLSGGFDVATRPVLSEDGVSDRFSNSISVLVEAEDE